MSQAEMIMDYLEHNGSITQAEAAGNLGCYRLASRVYDLKCQGVKFRRIMEEGLNRFGERVHYARYSLEGMNGKESDTLR